MEEKEEGQVIGPYDKEDWITMLLYRARLRRMRQNPIKYQYMIETEEKNYYNKYLKRFLSN